MRIALLTWAYPPEKSGLTRAAREIAQSLAERGDDVAVFTMDREGEPGEAERDGRVRVIGCALRKRSLAACLRKLPGLGHLVAPVAFRRAVAIEHRRAPFDIVEATNWYAPGLAIALFGPAPLVTRNSTPAATSAADVRSVRNRCDRRIAMMLERLGARRSRALISNTRAHGQMIAALYGVAAPGPRHAVVGLSLAPEIVSRGQAADYPVGGLLELLFIGRDERRKGYDAALGAIAILAREAASGALPEFRFTIVGVERVGQLPPAAAARVRTFHRVEEDMLHDLLAAAHVVVAPSRYESFGLVYQEAMMFGRPIVACAEDPSARAFVGGSGAGLLAERCTGADVAAALRSLIIDPELRLRLAAASRPASGRFTRASLGDQTMALYATAIE